MSKDPIRLQSNVAGKEGEAIIVEDDDHLWAVEVKSSPLVRAALERIRKNRGAGEFKVVNPSMRRAKKSRQ